MTCIIITKVHRHFTMIAGPIQANLHFLYTLARIRFLTIEMVADQLLQGVQLL